MWPRRFESAVGLVLAALVFGAASSDGVRVCPHHGGEMDHGYVDLADHAAEGSPLDPGPCDHDLGICESVASEPDPPGANTALSWAGGGSDEIVLPDRERVRTSEPTFLLPYSTGPPSPPA